MNIATHSPARIGLSYVDMSHLITSQVRLVRFCLVTVEVLYHIQYNLGVMSKSGEELFQ